MIFIHNLDQKFYSNNNKYELNKNIKMILF